jgi:hypothetical protein
VLQWPWKRNSEQKLPALAKGTSTFYPFEDEPNVNGPVAPHRGVPGRCGPPGGCGTHQTKSGRHAATKLPRRRPVPTPADDGRASRPTRLTEPTARGAARRKLPKYKNKQPKKL